VVCSQDRPVNIKKAQFLAPQDMVNVLAKAWKLHRQRTDHDLRAGRSFGYNNLVATCAAWHHDAPHRRPVVFDVTHSLQMPGGLGFGRWSGGHQQGREMVPVLARAAVRGPCALGCSWKPIRTQRKRCDGQEFSWPLER
jgi:2-dehydro-3-deoxyphosphooctonate aldolase (KDO 8-P synthase)